MANIKSEQPKRIEGLDLIRALAIFLVILNHSLRTTFPVDDMAYFATVPLASKVFYFTCFALSAVSVPLFFLLSGYLLLPRNFDELKTKNFYKRNLLPLLLTWEMWIPLNNWLAWWYENIEFHGSVLLKNMLFIEPVHIGHSWYMPVIIGMYLFIPFVSRVLKTMSAREIFIPLSIVYFYLFIIPTVNRFRESPFDSCLDLSFSGGLYGTYIIIGYLLNKYEYRLKGSPKFTLMLLGSIVAIVLLQLWIYHSTGRAFILWFDIFLFPPMAISIFIVLRDMTFPKIGKLIVNISRCSFGMYLTHVFVIALFLKYGIFNFVASSELKILILSIFVYIFSFIVTMLIKKIPYLGKLLIR